MCWDFFVGYVGPRDVTHAMKDVSKATLQGLVPNEMFLEFDGMCTVVLLHMSSNSTDKDNGGKSSKYIDTSKFLCGKLLL